MANPYLPVQAELAEVVTETPTIKTFCLKPEKPIPFKAGQFMQLTVPGLGEAPFTPSSDPRVSDRMEITVLKTGAVTDKLHDLEAGAKLGLRGPFGKGYPLDELAGKQVVLVGGGVGLAPLRALIYALLAEPEKYEKIVILYGARTPAELSFRRQYEEWSQPKNAAMNVTIDVAHPDWDGHVGLVTTLLDELKGVKASEAIALSCGPEIMLKFVTLKLLEKGFKEERVYLSMNRRMSCGVGKCGRCNIGPYYLCKDGPDMCYAKIKDVADTVFG
ncbi:MAG: FAD/NAD(P)-binding protein [Planctomycetota bacterium]